jgi:hypothetical protein
VRDDEASLIPGQILLDADRTASGKGALQAICPLTLIGVTVVRVEDGAP